MFSTDHICFCICIFNSLYFPDELLLQCSGAAFRAARWLPNTGRGPWAGQHRPTILLHEGGLLPYHQAFTDHTSPFTNHTHHTSARWIPTGFYQRYFCIMHEASSGITSYNFTRSDSPIHQSTPHKFKFTSTVQSIKNFEGCMLHNALLPMLIPSTISAWAQNTAYNPLRIFIPTTISVHDPLVSGHPLTHTPMQETTPPLFS